MAKLNQRASWLNESRPVGVTSIVWYPKCEPPPHHSPVYSHNIVVDEPVPSQMSSNLAIRGRQNIEIHKNYTPQASLVTVVRSSATKTLMVINVNNSRQSCDSREVKSDGANAGG